MFMSSMGLPSEDRQPDLAYQHEATSFTPQGDVPLQALLSHLAREMDRKSAAGWDVLGPPMPFLSGPTLVGGAPKVTWVVWARRPKGEGVDVPEPDVSVAEAAGLSREAVPA